MDLDIHSEAFAQQAAAATRQAFERAIASGHPVFYQDEDSEMYIMQQGARRWEIRFLPGRPRDENFEIVRELPLANAA